MSNLPQRVGNYQLERQIGKGGMSEVWVARHRSLEDRLVAVKLLLSQDSEWIERFTREANITSRLRHQHIIQIYDHGYQHPYHYTIMEFVPGGALRELLKPRRPLSLELALHVLRCAGAALDYAHAHGVIHRDVSPGNILLEQNTERVLLTDFGIARVSGKTGMTTINKVMGTPGYLSPEHASSATAVTHLSDVYGLGVVLFEMLSGTLPWDHNPGMPPENSGGPFIVPPSLRSRGVEGLPADVDRVIQTMLMIDPAKRYPTVQAAIEDLDQVLARHTGQTQVVAPAANGAPGNPNEGTPSLRVRALAATPTVELHPVEKVLGPDLLKGPMQEARRRAEQLRDQAEITALLDRWSTEGRFRRKLLGRQVALHRVITTNVYFYTLHVLYETREPAKMVEEPDYKALAIALERERDVWDVELPVAKGFANDAGSTVTLPGSTQVLNCEKCKGIGRIICPRCQGRARIIAVRETKPAAEPAKSSTSAPADAGGQLKGSGATATAAVVPPPRPAPALIPCPDCSGTGGLPCERCDNVGRLVQKRTTTWRRRGANFKTNDDLPRIDEQWLERNCKHLEVYREPHKGGFRAEWQLVPALAELVGDARDKLDPNTRVTLSEVAISLIPVTEIVFDLGDLPAIPLPAKGKGKAPAPDAGLYRWHIYGFENRLPKDWRFLDWARVGVILLTIALVVILALLVLLLARIG